MPFLCFCSKEKQKIKIFILEILNLFVVQGQLKYFIFFGLRVIAIVHTHHGVVHNFCNHFATIVIHFVLSLCHIFLWEQIVSVNLFKIMLCWDIKWLSFTKCFFVQTLIKLVCSLIIQLWQPLIFSSWMK